jgi:glycosyltransferase involved in cell wall biosynthesis
MRILMGASVRDTTSTGVPRQMHELAQQFRAAGHTTDFAFLPERVGWPGSALSLWFSLHMLPRLVRGARRSEYDVYVLHAADGWLYGLLRWIARPLLRTPYVMASHGLEHRFWDVFKAEERAGRLKISFQHRLFTVAVRLSTVRLAVATCDRLICLTSAERGYIVMRKWKRGEKIAVIPNGVGPEFFGPPAALEAPLHKLLYVGPWTWNKGKRLMIACFSDLARRHRDLQLTVVGAAREPVLADFPADLHARIVTIDQLSPAEVALELPRHDVFLFPSLFEGGPLVLLEAMAASLAIVTSDGYAMAEVVIDGVDGLLIPLGDASALTAAVERLLESPELSRRLGEAARDRARKTSWRVSGERTLALLNELAPSGAQPLQEADNPR